MNLECRNWGNYKSRQQAQHAKLYILTYYRFKKSEPLLALAPTRVEGVLNFCILGTNPRVERNRDRGGEMDVCEKQKDSAFQKLSDEPLWVKKPHSITIQKRTKTHSYTKKKS